MQTNSRETEREFRERCKGVTNDIASLSITRYGVLRFVNESELRPEGESTS